MREFFKGWADFARRPILLPVVAMLAIPLYQHRTAQGGDILFLPGDAFFHATVSTREVEETWKSPEIELSYELPTIGQRAMGESVGAVNLKIGNVDSSLLDRIRRAYSAIRTEFPEKLQREMDQKGNVHAAIVNPMHIFIYSADYDVSSWAPFLKYNSDWIKVSKRLSPMTKVRACRFVPDLSGEEARFSGQVPVLNAEFTTKDVASVRSDDIRWLIVGDEHLRQHIKFEMGEVPQNQVVMYDVVPTATRVWRRESGSLRSAKE